METGERGRVDCRLIGMCSCFVVGWELRTSDNLGVGRLGTVGSYRMSSLII